MRGTAWMLAAVLGASGAAAVGLRAAPAAPLPSYGTIPAVTGTAVTAERAWASSTAALRGRVWIAGFVFTRCQGPCPLVTAAMAGLQERLPAGALLVSVTVDPEYDSSAVLRRYLRDAGADPKRWLAFRAATAGLYRLSYDGFKLSVFTDPSAPAGFRVRHDTRLALVDQAGVVRGYYATDGGVAPLAAARDAARLLTASR